MIGSSIGGYRITGKLGQGGMGEVYRARDSRLDRDVAVKVLPARLGSDAQGVARFEREARALAALSHPNIAVILGVEEVGATQPGEPPTRALILELVEGETLAERLVRGPLGQEDALAIAGQIAGALEAAHAKGIVHRDLKPANVKITSGGVVKVLDFGLAKILASAAGDDPTLTLTAAAFATGSGAPGTQIGTILGTPAYMAPEQVQGQSVDTRADVWAFGVVLYEMVTGERLFRGESIRETLTAVLTAEPAWDRIPTAFQPLLRACLERDPQKRLRDVGDFRFLIGAVPGAVAGDPARRRRRWMAPAIVTLLMVLAALGAWGWLRPRPESPREPSRFSTLLPAGVSVTRGSGIAASIAVSPDGRTIVIAGTDRNGQRLYRRTVDRVDVAPIAGTDRGSSPFFSWDGAWIGFTADGRLKRVPLAGGSAADIVATPGYPAGASWGADDRIVYAFGAFGTLHTVDARGGQGGPLAGVDKGRHPDVLPDGRTLLYESEGWIHSYDRATARSTRLVEGSSPRYVDGHLILSRGTTVFGATLDLARVSPVGAVVPLVEGVALDSGSPFGVRHYGLSRAGTLAFAPGADAYSLLEVGANGTERVVVPSLWQLGNPRYSRDGRRVVVSASRRDGEPEDLWVHDLQTGTATRLTDNGGRAPFWTPGDATVTYSHLGQQQGIYERAADGRGDARRLLEVGTFHWLVGWTPDRGTLAYGVMEGNQSSIAVLTGNTSRRIVGPGSVWGGRLSRDGKWLVYYSLDSGSFEIWVTSFPGVESRWLIGDGTDPAWAPGDSEIFYRSGGQLMAARIDKTAGVRVLSRRVVIDSFQPPKYDDYDIHPDGRSVLLVQPANRLQSREVTTVLDWFTEVRRLVRGS